VRPRVCFIPPRMCSAENPTEIFRRPAARWSAAALFQIRDGKLAEFIKDRSKLSMWEQLGWPINECLTQA
jgi:hypothetical protein